MGAFIIILLISRSLSFNFFFCVCLLKIRVCRSFLFLGVIPPSAIEVDVGNLWHWVCAL
ncbi:uncharacterized protein FOBCDRAFT_33225 [Fusarium oxysporum Fo47]|uniref:uncharacterized protein n=1 Tax=Fusarium oxysporum Fo47 TaxID=660027 RepID=UPI002869886C|nr:uncharacterized protein FOBCDRAFT_33225 [Fusarium oxysporum Fo47]WJG35278.1 hypothetical protein FOBCDRAFT_33225 [Fusarium oxysporum Fo47]